MNILNAIGAGIVAVGLFIGSLFGYTPYVQAPIETPSEELGVALPSGTANFESALATGITSAATTMTLTSISIRGGGSLSGYQCFTIDEGSAQSEFVCGTASSTSSGLFTGLERGISPADGITEDTDLQFSHRRGASVKITDFPLIQRINSQASGSGTYENVLQYASSISTSTVSSNGQNLANVAYVNSLSFGGVAASASSSVAGFVELATGGEAASTTIFGTTGAMLALHTGISTSSAPASGNVVVVTGDDGNIDSGFIPDIVGSTTIRATTTTGVYTKPAGVKHIVVEVQGAGGDGGADNNAGGGGGGGGYAKKTFSASELSATTSVVVGTAGIGSGDTSFGTVTAGNGGDGVSTGAAGAGGTASGGDVNINGQTGGTGGSCTLGGAGGHSKFGFGAPALFSPGGTTEAAGINATGYGAGGGGAISANDCSPDNGVGGGAGTVGIVIITEYF